MKSEFNCKKLRCAQQITLTALAIDFTQVIHYSKTAFRVFQET